MGTSSNKRAFACECIQPKEPAQALNENKAVFSGKVVGIDVQPENFHKIVKFDVAGAWKGISNATVTAVTGADSGSCGFPFEDGKEYLVYSYDSYGGDSKSLLASICSRTALLFEAQDDLKVLGAGYVPTKNEVYVIRDSQGVGGTIPLIAGIGIARAGVVAYLTLRKRK